MIRINLIIISFCATLLFAPASQAAEFLWGVQGGVRAGYTHHPFLTEETFSQEGDYLTGASVLLKAFGLVQFSTRFSMTMQLNMGELFLGRLSQNDQGSFGIFLNSYNMNAAQSQEKVSAGQIILEEGAFLHELYLTWTTKRRPWAHLNVGINQIKLGNGFIFDGSGIGLFFKANWLKRRYYKRKPLQFRTGLFLPDSSWTAQDKKSPVAYVELSLKPKRTESHLTASVAYMYDGEKTGSRMHWTTLYNQSKAFRDLQISPSCQVRSSRCDKLPDSSGNHVWIELSGMMDFATSPLGFFMGLRAILYAANLDVTLPDLKEGLDIVGGFFDIEAGIYIGPFKLAFSVMFESPSTNSEDGGGSYASISSKITKSSITQKGGINRFTNKNRLSVSQLYDGYLAFYVGLEFESRKVEAKLSTSIYHPIEDTIKHVVSPISPEKDRSIEINASFSYDLSSRLKLVSQFDLLLPNKFIMTNSELPVVQFWIGLDFSFLG